VILTPPERHPVLKGSDIAVMLRPGASFGCGQHPTTRLAIQGIEYTLKTLRICDGIANTMLLDIGTGSGVLAICALKMGIHRAMGTDMDPCAIAEAGENARIKRSFASVYGPGSAGRGNQRAVSSDRRQSPISDTGRVMPVYRNSYS